LVLDSLFSGKIRIALLTKLFINPASRVYLRGVERELGVSSNTVRLELNKLHDMHLIQVHESSDSKKIKHYSVNVNHPLFNSMRGVIMNFVGLDQIMEQVIHKLGTLEKVYLTGDLAKGKNSTFVDLVLVGQVNKQYMNQLIEKVEPIISKKIRVALFDPAEFKEELMVGVDHKLELLG
jgi:predicted AAA+ superfamily ATPase